MAVLRNVKVLFSNVTNVDDFSQKYQIVVSMTEDQAADAESEGLKVKTKEYDGKTQYQATFKTKFKPEVLEKDGKSHVDLQGGEIGRHSLVNVQYSFRDWTSPTGTSGTSADLNKVQVLDMQGSNSSEFGDESVGDTSDSEF